MTLDLSHLPTALRERACDSNQDRIRQVKEANWVGYTRANRALERLDEMIEQPINNAHNSVLGHSRLIADANDQIAFG